METLICEKIVRVIKNKKLLEEKLGVKITNQGKEVTIDGPSENVYFAEKVISALDFGFPFSVALLVKDDNFMLDILNIKEYTRKKNLREVRARLIGTKGKTLRALQDLTGCHFEIKENQVGIVGDPEYIRNAQEAVTSLVRGAKQGNVYAFLEKHHTKPVIDLGLKEPKKKFRRKQ